VGQRRQVRGRGLALSIDGLTPIAGSVPRGDACRRTAEDDRGIPPGLGAGRPRHPVPFRVPRGLPVLKGHVVHA
jgi:hypothetical protein